MDDQPEAEAPGRKKPYVVWQNAIYRIVMTRKHGAVLETCMVPDSMGVMQWSTSASLPHSRETVQALTDVIVGFVEGDGEEGAPEQ
jgi:hypothetical protein